MRKKMSEDFLLLKLCENPSISNPVHVWCIWRSEIVLCWFRVRLLFGPEFVRTNNEDEKTKKLSSRFAGSCVWVWDRLTESRSQRRKRPRSAYQFKEIRIAQESLVCEPFKGEDVFCGKIRVIQFGV